MATVVNFIDVTLRGAAARTVNLASAKILLTPSAPAFHVDAKGVITPEAITFTATKIDIDAQLAFNATGAPLANVTAESVTITGASMTGSSVTVIASATVNGQLYTGPCTISKFSDGKDGKDATDIDLSPGALKAILEGQITTDELTAALTSRIDLIDAGADTAGSVAARVKYETDQRIAAISQASTDNRTYVQQYTYSQQTINDSFSAFGTNIQASYQGYADGAAGGALAAAKSFAQAYAYSRADADSALTATANTLRSEFATLNQGTGATVAWVQTYAYSRAEADSAIASATQQLSTTVAGHTTTIETQSQSINGLSAQYSVKVDNNNYVSGFGLSSTPINGVPTSSFIVLADRFAVALPGQPAKYPFAIGKVAGQTTITFNGNIIADGSFTFRDANGKVLLSVGVPLDPSLAAPGTLNSDIKVGGRNLFPDGDFERGIHALGGVGYTSVRLDNVPGVGVTSGTKAFFIEGNGIDMYAYLGTRVAVAPGMEYQISFDAASATGGAIEGSCCYLRLWDLYENALTHFPLSISNLGAHRWDRQVISFVCPPGVYFVEPRLGLRTNGSYSWLAVDCVQVEQGTTATQFNRAPEDVAADVARAQADATSAMASIRSLSADNILAPGEKPEAERKYNNAYNEFATIYASASARGAGAERDAYSNRFYELQSYLGALPWWGNYENDTPIDRAIFDARFENYYAARQVVLNTIDSLAAGTSTWAGTSGAGKPQDNATVGAPSGTYVGGTEAGLVASRALNGDSAFNALPGINQQIDTRLRKDGNDVISGTVGLQSKYALLVGDTTNGVWIGSEGIVLVQGGVIKVTIPLSGDPTFAGKLMAVSIAAAGFIQVGARTWDSGTGVWFGFHNGVPKLAIGVAGGTEIKWDGTQLFVNSPTITSPTMDEFSISIPAGTLNSSGANGARTYGSRTASIIGGKAPISISWTYQRSDDGIGSVILSDTTSQTLTLSGSARNTNCLINAIVKCTATDANARTTSATFSLNASHGTASNI